MFLILTDALDSAIFVTANHRKVWKDAQLISVVCNNNHCGGVFVHDRIRHFSMPFFRVHAAQGQKEACLCSKYST